METSRVGWHGLVVLLLAAGLGAGCEYRSRTDQAGPSEAEARTRPDQIAWDARFTLNEDGLRRATIRADRMAQYQTDDSTYSVWHTLSDSARVRSDIFERGDSSATITADSVVYLSEKGRFVAFGNVIVVTTEGRRLESEKLIWDQIDRTIRTRRFVHIVTPTEDVRGNGLVADEDLETYQIGRFEARVDVEEEEDP